MLNTTDWPWSSSLTVTSILVLRVTRASNTAQNVRGVESVLRGGHKIRKTQNIRSLANKHRKENAKMASETPKNAQLSLDKVGADTQAAVSAVLGVCYPTLRR